MDYQIRNLINKYVNCLFALVGERTTYTNERGMIMPLDLRFMEIIEAEAAAYHYIDRDVLREEVLLHYAGNIQLGHHEILRDAVTSFFDRLSLIIELTEPQAKQETTKCDWQQEGF